ncbi:hypothetical protein ACH41E_00085 [Streptomyces sp. NPDC020412]|uniref:hypothetical protein n=1 Tax=Streptomyces sp. NPDC020412 TaxID=3365073 RepID=UPI0037910813
MAEEPRDEALQTIADMHAASEAARDTTLPPEIRALAAESARHAANKLADEHRPS